MIPRAKEDKKSMTTMLSQQYAFVFLLLPSVDIHHFNRSLFVVVSLSLFHHINQSFQLT